MTLWPTVVWGTFAAWIAFVAVVIAVVARIWKPSPARAALPLGLAALMAVCVLIPGANSLATMYTKGMWTAASVSMGFFPVKALLYAFVGHLLGRTINAARAATDTTQHLAKRWAIPGILAAVALVALADDAIKWRNAALEQHAERNDLSTRDVAALVQKIRAGQATRDEQGAFLGNALCPAELLTEFAASPDSYWRRAVARNDAISPEIADQLSRDPTQEVRFLLSFNRDLPLEILSRLAADTDEDVRKNMVWTKRLPDADYAKLARDPSAGVRELVARQERTSMEDWARLREDPDERVRSAARQWDAK
jgi:hypothetical protein